VKSDGNIFRLQCEPRNRVSREDHHTQLIKYDDRMRQEEKKYSQLLSELNKSYWFTRHVSTRSGFDQSGPHKSDILNGFAKYAVDQTMDEDLLSDLEVTRLTGDEILYGNGLTMDQVLLKNNKPSMSDVDGRSDRNSTQHSVVFLRTLSQQGWRGVRSLSLSEHGSHDKYDINITYRLSSE
jgi:hypothetical protein